MIRASVAVMIASLGGLISSVCVSSEPGKNPVFAHYLMCCPYAGQQSRTADYAAEISMARDALIDGFVLNIGAWEKEPGYRFRTDLMFSAADADKRGFKLFISADNATDLSAEEVVAIVERYHNRPSYFRYGGKTVLSTFGGTLSWRKEIRSRLAEKGIEIFFVPNIREVESLPKLPGAWIETPNTFVLSMIAQENRDIDGYFYFGAAGNFEDVSNSSRIASQIFKARKLIYMAPVSPAYKGNGPNNRVFEYEGLRGMIAQWNAAISAKADWVEIVTWNDWGESSYVRLFGGPQHEAIWNGNWGSLPAHDAFLMLSKYYIEWFKTGRQPKVNGKRVYIVARGEDSYNCIFRRETPGKTCPQGSETLRKDIYLVAEVDTPARITLTVDGSNLDASINAGVSSLSMAVEKAPSKISVALQYGTTFDEKSITMESLRNADDLNPTAITLEFNRP